MNITEIKTNFHVQTYFGELIEAAEKEFGPCPTYSIERNKWRDRVMTRVLSGVHYGAHNVDMKKAREVIGIAYADSAISYAEYFLKLGVFGKIKANNNLRDFGKQHSEFMGQLNYTAITGDPVRQFNTSATPESQFIGMVYKEVAKIARLGAKSLSDNDKAKYPVYIGNGICRGSAHISGAVLHENRIRFTVHGVGAPAITTGRQLLRAFSKMDVVHNVDAIKGSNQYRIEVTIRPEMLCGYKPQHAITPMQAKAIVEVEKAPSVGIVLQNVMKELQKEKDSLNERKQQLNDEHSAVSARIIQISRQMAAMHTAWEAMSEKPADGVKN